ncbi:MAG: carbohydrate ABC transporter substrate-binding protein, partial [Clostridiales bacterium]|nr:carbohydrate ABC transporter substrate-binding protein [Clostridiales bacterium]
MKNKKVLSVLLAAAMAATLVAGCGSDDGKDNASGDSGKTGSGDVTLSIVGIKSEIYDQWEAMQEVYTDIAG